MGVYATKELLQRQKDGLRNLTSHFSEPHPTGKEPRENE